MGDFTPEQKRRYVESGGTHCPACQSDHLVGGDVEMEGEVRQSVRCHACGIGFTDVYRLATVETDELPGDPDPPTGAGASLGATALQPGRQVRREAQPT